MKYSSAERANIAHRLAFGKDLEEPLTKEECPFFCETSVYYFLKRSPKRHDFPTQGKFYNWFDTEYPLDESLNPSPWD